MPGTSQFPKQLFLVFKFITEIIPIVHDALDKYKRNLAGFGDAMLSEQAYSSLIKKDFHALGGSYYALYCPRKKRANLINLIVAYQTISDYLDNLCDRAGIVDETAFRQLHLSMIDAVSGEEPSYDYYKYYPSKEDGGYLNNLVKCCACELSNFPNYNKVKEEILKLVQLYSDLQVHKHKEIEKRESSLIKWSRTHLYIHNEFNWWELSAAAGSTLCVFMLFAVASKDQYDSGETQAIIRTYFPWICSFHILLDYLIDLNEDEEEGDLNFVACYKTQDQCIERMTYIYKQSNLLVENLSHMEFHKAAINGLIALYLSDPKTKSKHCKDVVSVLLKEGGYQSRLLTKCCQMIRKIGVI